MTTTQVDLAAAYLTEYNRALEKLGRPRDLVMERPSPNMAACDFGTVGDLASLNRRLDELVAWMGNPQGD